MTLIKNLSSFTDQLINQQTDNNFNNERNYISLTTTSKVEVGLPGRVVKITLVPDVVNDMITLCKLLMNSGLQWYLFNYHSTA